MTDRAGGQGAECLGPGARDDLAPGGPRAKARGCLCSVLANAAYRSGADQEPCVDPRCVMHACPEGTS